MNAKRFVICVILWAMCLALVGGLALAEIDPLRQQVFPNSVLPWAWIVMDVSANTRTPLDYKYPGTPDPFNNDGVWFDGDGKHGYSNELLGKYVDDWKNNPKTYHYPWPQGNLGMLVSRDNQDLLL